MTSRNEIAGSGLLALTLALAVYSICIWFGFRDAVSDHQAIKLIVCLMVLTVTSVFSSLFYKQIENLVIYLIIGYSIYEIILGVAQLAGWSESNHILFNLTGSFMNPNLYGDWLALSFGIVLMILLSGQRKEYFKIILKIVLYAESVVIPITRCRSAYLAVGISVFFILIQQYDSIKRIIVQNRVLVLTSVIVFMSLLLVWKHQSTEGRIFIYRMGFISMINNGFKHGGLGHYQDLVSKTQLDYFHDQITISDGCFDIPDNIAKESLLCSSPEYALCDPLQIGIEMGLTGVFLYLGVMALSILTLYIRKSPLLYGLVSVQIASLFSYPMCITQFQLFVAACVGLSISGSVRKKIITIPLFSLLLMSFFILAWRTGLFNRDEYREWQSDRLFYNAGDYEVYSDLCAEKKGCLDYSIDFLYQYGRSLAETSNYEKSDSVLKIGANYFGNPAFYMILGQNSFAQHRYEQAESYYWKAFCSVPNHITPLCKIAELYLEQGDTAKYDNMLLSIESLNTKNDPVRKEMILNSLKEKSLKQ